MFSCSTVTQHSSDSAEVENFFAIFLPFCMSTKAWSLIVLCLGLDAEFLLNKSFSSSMNSSSVTNSLVHVLYVALRPVEQMSWSNDFISIWLLQAHPCCQSLYGSPQGITCTLAMQSGKCKLEPQNLLHVMSNAISFSCFILCCWPTWEINYLAETEKIFSKKINYISERREQQ
jgi:hypothetical protein